MDPISITFQSFGMFSPRRDTPSHILKFLFCVLGFVIVVVLFGIVIPLLLFCWRKSHDKNNINQNSVTSQFSEGGYLA